MDNISDISDYCEHFSHFIKIVIQLEQCFSTNVNTDTEINFANISNQIVFIDTIKYIQLSLVFLAKTMTKEEKKTLK